MGIYGFYDAFSEQKNWYPERYLAIDQGTSGNYDRKLQIWSDLESIHVKSGNQKWSSKLGFSYWPEIILHYLQRFLKDNL